MRVVELVTARKINVNPKNLIPIGRPFVQEFSPESQLRDVATYVRDCYERATHAAIVNVSYLVSVVGSIDNQGRHFIVQPYRMR